MKRVAVPQPGPMEMAPQRPGAGWRVEHWFYISAGLFMILLSIVGFGPSLIDPSRRNAPFTQLLAAHGIAVGAWLLLFLTQTILVATGRTTVHRRLGTVGPVLASLMIVLGYVVLIGFGRRGYDLSGDVIRALSRTGRPSDPAALLFPLNELLSFGVLVAAGLWYRHQSDIHKRLMLLAMVPVLTEPLLHLVGHLTINRPSFRGGGTTIAVPITLALLSVSAIHDLWSRRRIHPVSLWVPILFFVWQNVLVFVVFPSAAWRKLSVWMIQ